ncbi:MAG TPA: CaiB/BaiF CoA-transferase family protein, partial [Pseudonocardiaceae bacterium]
MTDGPGPLAGLRVVELAGIGPGPFAAQLLAGMGASVTRVQRSGAFDPSGGVSAGGRERTVEVDLKDPAGRDAVLALVDEADVLLEGYRPGVLERLGLGPDVCLERNPRLVYARLTGWGQDGPLAPRAGHDLNYIALTGALGAFARDGQPPTPPVNLVGDFAGGSLYLLFGVLSALYERSRSGLGQVVDAAMIDGVAGLMGFVYELRSAGVWDGPPGTNLLDTGAPFYDVYPCSDGRYLAVGCLEPQFYAAFLAGLGLDGADLPPQYDRTGWPRLRAEFTGRLAARTRDEWAAVFEGTDACVTPVLSLDEAPEHPHNAARGTYRRTADGGWAPAPAPRLS